MAGARRFEELVCWQLTRDFKRRVYAVLQRPLVQRDLRFSEQFRDAAASAPRNIAEGFGRRTPRDFARFLDIARASLIECENHLHDAVDRGYLTEAERQELSQLGQRCAASVSALQKYLRGKCPPTGDGK